MGSIIDLSQGIFAGMPVYPGTEPPLVTTANTVEQDGFLEHKITIYSHTGTHMDAPSHIFPSGKNLDDFDISRFTGPACIVDASGKRSLTREDLSPLRGLIATMDFVLLRTDWSRRWGHNDYYGNYPTLTVEAAAWLAAFPLKGIGVDAISVDPIDVASLPVHRELLKKDILIIENLTGLDRVHDTAFTLVCLPLPLRNADGAPTRVIAMEK